MLSVNTIELVPRFSVFSDSANQAFRQLSERFVALASQLPAVQQVLLEGTPPELQLCTVIDADPQDDFPEHERVYQVEEEVTRANPDAPTLNFRVINRAENHSRDFEGELPRDIHVLFRR